MEGKSVMPRMEVLTLNSRHYSILSLCSRDYWYQDIRLDLCIVIRKLSPELIDLR